MRLFTIFLIILFLYSCADNVKNEIPNEIIYKTHCYDTSIVWIYPIEEPKDTLFRLAMHPETGKRIAKDGHWIVYFDKAQTKKAYECVVKNGMEVGTYTHWRRNGTKRYERSGIGDIDTGYCRSWYPNNQLQYESYYRNDTIVGTFKEYYESGELKSEDYYKYRNTSRSIKYNKNKSIKGIVYYSVTDMYKPFSMPYLEIDFGPNGELIKAYKYCLDSAENKKDNVKVWFNKKVDLDSL